MDLDPSEMLIFRPDLNVTKHCHVFQIHLGESPIRVGIQELLFHNIKKMPHFTNNKTKCDASNDSTLGCDKINSLFI